jgi:alpha-tubulin suppressor-like RCC1 family protein
MRPWIVALVLSASACGTASRVAGVTCSDNGDCVLGGVSGNCESTGFCSYPDPACVGGRYSPAAGNGLGNSCVGGPAACGDKGQSCCNGSLCTANLECDMSKTCVCGAQGEVCCGGTTCDSNLACVDGACACGGIAEPCCGGSTCNAGLACTGGTCGSDTVLQIALGMGHGCALRADHTVSCWGFDEKAIPYGVPALGQAVVSSQTPYTIPGLTDVAEIHAAEMHTCARKMDNTLWCWGHNESGQLGNGTFYSSAAPVQVSGLTNVSLFDGGRMHTCAVGDVGGTHGLWCWGRNSTGGKSTASGGINTNLGRLGDGDLMDSNVPVQVSLGAATSAGQTVKSLSTGNYHSCVVMSDNKVWCWGRGTQGQLGDGTATDTRVPVQVNLAGVALGGATIDQVICTDGRRTQGTSCLRTSAGKVHCWGYAADGELGDGTTVQRNAPTAAVDMTAMGGSTFAQLAAGQFVVCGRTNDGNVWCWGQNKAGVLGINDPMETNHPAPVHTLITGVAQLELSHRTACAIDQTQHARCWGVNRRGQASAAQPTGDGRVLQPTLLVLP